MFFDRVHSVAYSGIDGILDHVIPVAEKEIAKARGVSPFRSGADGKIKEYKHSHILMC